MKILRIMAIVLLTGLSLLVFAGCAAPKSDDYIDQEVFPKKGDVIINPFTGVIDDSYNPQNRPVAVMINNLRSALPQTGLQNADIVYEMVTEGGITRLLAVYSGVNKIETVGPVRSIRDQHIQVSYPYAPLYVHIGSSNIAGKMFEDLGYENIIDGTLGVTRNNSFYLDEERHKFRNIEHCFFTTKQLIENSIKEYGLNDKLQKPVEPVFKFTQKDAKRALNGGDAVTMAWNFSASTDTGFVLNTQTNRYEKSEYGVEQIDTATNQPLSFDNVLVLFTEIKPYPDGTLANVSFSYGGYGFYFNAGRYERIRWVKGDAANPLRIVDVLGNETDVEINPGNTYVAVVGLSEYKTLSINNVPVEE